MLRGVSVGGATADAAGSWSYTSPSLADGAYTYSATQTDTAGNTSAASSAFVVTVDTAIGVPAITAMSDDTGTMGETRITSDTTPTLSGTAEANATVTVLRSSVAGSVRSLPTPPEPGATPAHALTDGAYTYSARPATPRATPETRRRPAFVVTIDSAAGSPRPS